MVRPEFGPVILDFSFVYPLDGKKLYCVGEDPAYPPGSGVMCNGEIDYDGGFNGLYCTKCGRRYLAVALRADETENKQIRIIETGGKFPMKVYGVRGTEIVANPYKSSDVMTKPPKAKISQKKSSTGPIGFTVKGVGGYDKPKQITEPKPSVTTEEEFKEKLKKFDEEHGAMLGMLQTPVETPPMKQITIQDAIGNTNPSVEDEDDDDISETIYIHINKEGRIVGEHNELAVRLLEDMQLVDLLSICMKAIDIRLDSDPLKSSELVESIENALKMADEIRRGNHNFENDDEDEEEETTEEAQSEEPKLSTDVVSAPEEKKEEEENSTEDIPITKKSSTKKSTTPSNAAGVRKSAGKRPTAKK